MLSCEAPQGVLQPGASIHSLPKPSPNAMLQRSRTGYKARTSRDLANHSLGRIMISQGVGDGLRSVEMARKFSTAKSE